MNGRAALALAFALASCTVAGEPPATKSTMDTTLVRVVDGDTIEVQADGRDETVRLIGIDAPERGECYADEATAALSELVEGAELELAVDTSDRDRHGRLLRYVIADGQHVNAELVLRGAAVARDYPPDTARSDELHDAGSHAREAGRGLWSACA